VPDGSFDQRGGVEHPAQVDPGGDPGLFEEVDDLFGGDVAARARASSPAASSATSSSSASARSGRST
jgi:hypothetical protein